MIMTLEQLKEAAADLPGPERAELVDYFVRTLGDREAAAIKAEWVALAERRMADVKAGTAAGIPADEVLLYLSIP